MTVDASWQGAAVAIDVETGQVLASYRMDVAARRLASRIRYKAVHAHGLTGCGIVKEETSLFLSADGADETHILDCSHPGVRTLWIP